MAGAEKIAAGRPPLDTAELGEVLPHLRRAISPTVPERIADRVGGSLDVTVSGKVAAVGLATATLAVAGCGAETAPHATAGAAAPETPATFVAHAARATEVAAAKTKAPARPRTTAPVAAKPAASTSASTSSKSTAASPSVRLVHGDMPAGSNLWKMAKHVPPAERVGHGSVLEEDRAMMHANDVSSLEAATKMQPGSILIPERAEPDPAAAEATQGTSIYIVRVGDNLSDIAADQAESLRQLERQNQNVPDVRLHPNLIHPGDQLVVRAGSSSRHSHTPASRHSATNSVPPTPHAKGDSSHKNDVPPSVNKASGDATSSTAPAPEASPAHPGKAHHHAGGRSTHTKQHHHKAMPETRREHHKRQHRRHEAHHNRHTTRPDCSAHLVGRNNDQKIFNYWMCEGYPRVLAAADVGNADQETGPVNPNPRLPSHDSQAGGGIAQWDGGRFIGLQRYAAETHRSSNSLGTQLDYTRCELTHCEPYVEDDRNVLRMIEGTTSPGYAAYIFCKFYERAGTPMLSKREQYAIDAMRNYGRDSRAGIVAAAEPHHREGRHEPHVRRARRQRRANSLGGSLAGVPNAIEKVTRALPKAFGGPAKEQPSLGSAGSAITSSLHHVGSEIGGAFSHIRPERHHPEIHKAADDSNGLDGYENPFRDIPDVQASRADMGADYNGSGPVHPLGKAVITWVARGTSTYWGGYGGNSVVYKLETGKYAGKYVYTAEHCPPASGLRIGQTVTVKSVICTMQPASLEMGFGSGQADTPLASGSYSEGNATVPGAIMSQLVEVLSHDKPSLMQCYDHPGQRLEGSISGSLPWPVFRAVSAGPKPCA